MDNSIVGNAKKIFFKYGGNKYQMFRDEVLEEYKNCNITEEQELQWIDEIKNTLREKINYSQDLVDIFVDYGMIVKEYNDITGFDEMIKMAEEKIYNCSDFDKLRIIEEIVLFANELVNQKKGLFHFFKSKIDIDEKLKKILKKAIILSETILKTISINKEGIKYYQPSYLNEFVDKDMISKRLESDIKIVNKIKNML